jgi:hypothetical protein
MRCCIGNHGRHQSSLGCRAMEFNLGQRPGHLSRVRMLVLNRDRICFKVHWPLPACVRGAVSNMNLLFHDGASILLALVTESRWFQLFGKALHHFSCAADFLEVFELNFSNTLSGGLLLNTHQLCFSQFWQLTWQSLPHKNFKGKVIGLGVKCAWTRSNQLMCLEI